MPSEAGPAPPSLYPQQVCFVVADLPAAVSFCEEQFGWGPFHQFTAQVPDASYKEWQGEKRTEVALGMAGKVQVEFLHVHQGHDTTQDYQAKYGTGFQHLGIYCKSREAALAHLESLGGVVNELNDYPGIRFAFVDVPTGPGMFEILQPTAELSANEGLSKSAKAKTPGSALFDLDRATIVTQDIKAALNFYAAAFGWQNPVAERSTLRYGGEETQMLRFIRKAGVLELEFIQPDINGSDPYATHLQRGNHGLTHVGGASATFPADAALSGQWLETEESFALYDWADSFSSLQVRHCA